MTSAADHGPSWPPQPARSAHGAAPPQGWVQLRGPYADGVPYRQQVTNGLAIASLVLGIVWVYWLGSILAVVLGHVALRQIRRDPHQTGRGLAITGLVLGYLGVVVLVLLIVAMVAAVRSAQMTGDPGTTVL